LTGVEEQSVLIDGTVRQTPVAKIHVETPYFTGVTTAVCMKEPLYDLIIGNVKGVHHAHGHLAPRASEHSTVVSFRDSYTVTWWRFLSKSTGKWNDMGTKSKLKSDDLV